MNRRRHIYLGECWQCGHSESVTLITSTVPPSSIQLACPNPHPRRGQTVYRITARYIGPDIYAQQQQQGDNNVLLPPVPEV